MYYGLIRPTPRMHYDHTFLGVELCEASLERELLGGRPLTRMPKPYDVSAASPFALSIHNAPQ